MIICLLKMSKFQPISKSEIRWPCDNFYGDYKAVEYVVKCATATHMALNLGKTVIVSFTRKTNLSYILYEIDGSKIQCGDLGKNLREN